MKKLGSRHIALTALIAGFVFASSAHAVWTFDQSNVTNLSEVTPDQNAGDPKLSLTGVYATNGTGNVGFASGATWTAASLSYFSGNGQGMYTGTDSTSPYHAIDNNGNTEAVLLKFDTSIVLSGIGLGYATNTAGTNGPVDISLFRWTGSGTPTGNPTPLVGVSASAMTGWQLVGNYGDMTVDKTYQYNTVNTGGTGTGGAGGLGSSWWLISAYNSGYTGALETRDTLDQGNDFFKLYAVAGTKCTSTASGVCGPTTTGSPPVPEPASLALVAVGLAGAFGLRRRTAPAPAAS